MSRQEMSAADAAWLHMDRPTNLMVVNSVLVYDEPMDRDKIVEVLTERLIEPFPRFRQRVAEPRWPLARPAWEDDPHFSIDRHLISARLPEPGGDAELQDYVSRQMGMPLDHNRPLWEMHLIDGYQDGAATLTRMHHAIADGIALARLLFSLTDGAPDAPIADDVDDHGHRSLLDAALHEGLELVGLVGHPPRITSALRRAPSVAATLAKELFLLPDARTAFTGRNGITKRAAWTRPIPLERVKAAAHASGATVNDLMLAAVSGALRHYLQQRGSPVHDLRAMVPFNLRPLDEPLPRDLGNRFGLVFLSLPLTVGDPDERVVEVHRRMNAIKASPEGAVSYGVLGLIGLTAPQVERTVVSFFASKATGVMTNVPGPREPVSLAGVPVRRVLPFVPRSGDISLGISIFSYAGEITVGFSTDAGLAPDPERIIEAFEHELAGYLERASAE